jgi:hypothetical protein
MIEKSEVKINAIVRNQTRWFGTNLKHLNYAWPFLSKIALPLKLGLLQLDAWSGEKLFYIPFLC